MDKIVLIEDDPGIRTVIRLALKGAGFTSICEAGNGTDGLVLVQREKPALVILDLMLPGMDGLAVCSAIRRSSFLPALKDDALSPFASPRGGQE